MHRRLRGYNKRIQTEEIRISETDGSGSRKQMAVRMGVMRERCRICSHTQN